MSEAAPQAAGGTHAGKTGQAPSRPLLPGRDEQDSPAGSCATEKDGEPASPPRDRDYPLTAGRKTCRGRIRRRQPRQAGWRHAPLQPAADGGDTT